MIMEKQSIEYLEAQVKELSRSLASLANEKDWQALIPIWRRPGWTTPAEFVLVTGVVNSIVAQTKTLINLKEVLIKGSREVIAQ